MARVRALLAGTGTVAAVGALLVAGINGGYPASRPAGPGKEAPSAGVGGAGRELIKEAGHLYQEDRPSSVTWAQQAPGLRLLVRALERPALRCPSRSVGCAAELSRPLRG